MIMVLLLFFSTGASGMGVNWSDMFFSFSTNYY
jgi:hypothetical protein